MAIINNICIMLNAMLSTLLELSKLSDSFGVKSFDKIPFFLSHRIVGYFIRCLRTEIIKCLFFVYLFKFILVKDNIRFLN